jgi:Holliday junction resolvase
MKAAINSRTKGASSERELAGLIHDHLGVRLVRILTQSRDGGYDLEPAPNQTGPVVDCLRGVALEVKRYQAVTPSLLARFWSQAVRQAEAAGLVPALAWRADRQPWRVTVPLAWLAGMGNGHDLEHTADLSIPAFCLAVRERTLGGGSEEG